MVAKIDSNITGLALAEETNFGETPANAVWTRYQPNSYSDFGAEVQTVSPNPIRSNRSRGFSRAVQLNNAGGMNHNLSYSNLTKLMQGVMFADLRKSIEGVPTMVEGTANNMLTFNVANHDFQIGNIVLLTGFDQDGVNGTGVVTTSNTNDFQVRTASSGVFAATAPAGDAAIKVIGHQYTQLAVTKNAGSYPTISIPQAQQATSLNFTDDSINIVPGTSIYVGGGDGEAANANLKFTTDANNGLKRVREVNDHEIVLDKSASAMVTEAAAAGKTIQIYFGNVLRNENSVGDANNPIKRRSYTMERLLGRQDDAGVLRPNEQSEQVLGAVPNEFTLTIPQAELINFDVNFMGINTTQRDGKAGNEPLQKRANNTFDDPEALPIYNGTFNVEQMRMNIIEEGNEAKDALFGYLTTATLTVNNNVTINQAIGTYGGFETTVGTFIVNGSSTVYFSDVAATQAVIDNEPVTISIELKEDNQCGVDGYNMMVFDLPLVSLSDSRNNVELDAAIMATINYEAGSGEELCEGYDHTLMITYLDYLPPLSDTVK